MEPPWTTPGRGGSVVDGVVVVALLLQQRG
jgi:hypothetical protein